MGRKYFLPDFFGEMSELVEGARLESAYMGNCIKGSNPFLSAIFIGVGSLAIEPCEPRQIRKEATISNALGVPRIAQLFFYFVENANLIAKGSKGANPTGKPPWFYGK